MGISTGGAYAFALAASAPGRVSGVVAGCAMTDMSHPPARASMHSGCGLGIWNAPNRDAALSAAVELFGEDGSKFQSAFADPPLPQADIDAITDPALLEGAQLREQARFANGVEGYVDDRLADGPGWSSFDIQVHVLHAIPTHAAVVNPFSNTFAHAAGCDLSGDHRPW